MPKLPSYSLPLIPFEFCFLDGRAGRWRWIMYTTRFDGMPWLAAVTLATHGEGVSILELGNWN